MKRTEKQKIIADLEEKISRAKSLFFADFTGITVSEVNELRREFRKSSIDYQVVKNTLIRQALKNISEYNSVIDKLVGPTAIAFGYQDPVAPAKIIKKFREKNEKFKVKACVLEKQVFEAHQLDQLAKLPSRNEMISSILGSIQSPIYGVVGAIGAVIRDIVTIVKAIEDKKAA